jgi:hypothetical protein
MKDVHRGRITRYKAVGSCKWEYNFLYEYLRKSGEIGIEWQTSSLCVDKSLDRNLNIIKKNSEALLDASQEVGLEVNTEKSKYMVVSRYQDTKQS